MKAITIAGHTSAIRRFLFGCLGFPSGSVRVAFRVSFRVPFRVPFSVPFGVRLGFRFGFLLFFPSALFSLRKRQCIYIVWVPNTRGRTLGFVTSSFGKIGPGRPSGSCEALLASCTLIDFRLEKKRARRAGRIATGRSPELLQAFACVESGISTAVCFKPGVIIVEAMLMQTFFHCCISIIVNHFGVIYKGTMTGYCNRVQYSH